MSESVLTGWFLLCSSRTREFGVSRIRGKPGYCYFSARFICRKWHLFIELLVFFEKLPFGTWFVVFCDIVKLKAQTWHFRRVTELVRKRSVVTGLGTHSTEIVRHGLVRQQCKCSWSGSVDAGVKLLQLSSLSYDFDLSGIISFLHRIWWCRLPFVSVGTQHPLMTGSFLQPRCAQYHTTSQPCSTLRFVT